LPSFWKFVVSSAVQHPAGFGFPDAAPLLEEKRHTGTAALRANVPNPTDTHRAGAGAAFAAADS
jgi:hypothetical protein